MSKKLYVMSTLAAAQLYTSWAKGPNDMPIPGPSVHVAGGFGGADKYLRTATGATITPITEEQEALLRSNEVFCLHEQTGFVSISKESGDPDDIAADMNRNDPSAPLTPDDFGDRADTITTGAPGGDDEEVSPRLSKGRPRK